MRTQSILSVFFSFNINTQKKSCIQETPNLSTNAKRSIDTEKNIQGFLFFFWGFG